jgi:hypothetical protein
MGLPILALTERRHDGVVLRVAARQWEIAH